MKRRRAKAIWLAGAAALLLAGCGGDDDGDGQASDLPEGCTEVEAPAPKEVQVDPPKQDLSGPAKAVVETSCGSFTIELDTAGAPKTASSFANLAEQGFYDGLPFHRVVRGYVIQGGDPAGDGTGGPGYTVDEPPSETATYLRGTVAMAKNAAEPPGRSGSQFFVVTAPADAGLPPDSALLGRVSEGFDTIEKIDGLGDVSGGDGPPTTPVVIETIEIERG